ncbi:MAG TPA: DUF885 domain-containing protein [Steroidobacteraceae bacterium]
MWGYSSRAACGIAFFALAGCGAPSPTAPAPPAIAPPPTAQLNRIVEHYWDERLPTENVISPQLLADSLSIERRYLAELLGVSRDTLDAPSRLTYDIFRRRRELKIEAFTFPNELLPINPFGGMTQQVAAQARELAQNTAANAVDYANWLKQIDEYLRWTQQATANMREGMRRGYTSPRSVIERMLPILERLGTDDSANVFYAPLRSMPGSIKEPQRARLTQDLTRAIAEKLLPASRMLHDFLQKQYLPRARAGLALSELPLGREWYAFLVRNATSSALSSDEINRIGTAELERLGPPPPEAPPVDAMVLVNAYKEWDVQVQAALPSGFREIPKADLKIQGADWLPRPAASLYYQAGPPGADILLVNTGRGAKTALSKAGFLRLGAPGEHFQIALQQERTDLPRFRRLGAEAAFTAGWGLYAVSLGDTLGLYGDESAKLDAAATMRRCAVDLVVDTGLHAKGWTRGQAFDYLRAHLGVDDVDAQSLIDGYAASPAAALACVGAMKFRALRALAEQRLGGRFDLREFHSQILQDGAMPLDILEGKMKGWMEASK